MRKLALLLLLCTVFLGSSGFGCSSKSTATSDVRNLLGAYRQSMITYYQIKSLEDSAALPVTVNDYLAQLETAQNQLTRLQEYSTQIKDPKQAEELATFLTLAREREKLTLKYLEDIKKDLDYRNTNPDASVDINQYILNIPRDLLDLEYKLAESARRLEALLGK
ncbi:MAG: hypothetical protein ACOY81_07775 [Bacillota bacterium]